MLKTISNAFNALTQINTMPYFFYADALMDHRHKVGDFCEVLSTYKGALGKGVPEKKICAELSQDVKEGDFVIAIAFSGSFMPSLPSDFLSTVRVKKNGLHLNIGFKVHMEEDPTSYIIERGRKDLMVSVLTIRGPIALLDAKAHTGTAKGCYQDSFAPRINSCDNGALLTIFAYDDPNGLLIQNQKTLVSMKTGNTGLAVGISPTEAPLSDRITATGKEKENNRGDIAVALTLA